VRTIYERSTEEYPPSQNVTLSTDGSGTATIEMTKSDDERAWVVRVNLLVGQTLVSASVDGTPAKTQVYEPNEDDDGTLWMGYWPFGGEGSVPAANAGNVVEIKMPAGTSERKVEVVIGDKDWGDKKTKAASGGTKTKAASGGTKTKGASGGNKTKAPSGGKKTTAAPEPDAKGKGKKPNIMTAPKPEKKSKMETKPAPKETPETPPVIGASGLSEEAAQRLSQGTAATAASTGGCLLAVLALAGVAARVLRWRVPDELVRVPTQPPEAAEPLVEHGHAEEA